MVNLKQNLNYFQEQDRETLKDFYQKNNYPDQNDIEKLVRETNLNEDQVRNWFKRMRQKSKRKDKE